MLVACTDCFSDRHRRPHCMQESGNFLIMDKINDSEIKNAPPQNGNIANSNKLQNIREIHPIIKNLWFISILNFKLIFHKYFEQYGLQSKAFCISLP